MLINKKTNQFLAAVKYGSITKAAEEINITPSAISQGISELEQIIGKSLLSKTKNGMTLTNIGKYFYDEISPHVEALEKILLTIKSNKINKVVRIKSDGMYYPVIQEKLRSYMTSHPRVMLSCTCEVVQSIKHEMKNGFSDIVISPSDIELNGDSIKKIPLGKERVGVLVHKNLLDKHKNIKNLFKNEFLLQTLSTIEHIKFIQLKKRLLNDGFLIKENPMEIIDAIPWINEGLGFTFTTQEFVKSQNFNEDIIFISKPLPYDLFIYRMMYFVKNNSMDVLEVASLFESSAKVIK